MDVRSAQTKDIWPDGCPHSPEVASEIIQCARTAVTAEDVARSGLSYSSWYIPYYLAEQKVLARVAARKDAQRKQEVDLSREVVTLRNRVAKLEKRLNDNIKIINKNLSEAIPDAMVNVVNTIIEQKMCLRYTGVWSAEKDYGRGAACTDAGSVWVAIEPSKGDRPGKSVSWKLIAKGGAKELVCT